MIEMLNRLSGEWGNYLWLWMLQNTLFVGIVLLLLYVYRRRHPYFLRWIALLGLAKLLLPPIPGGQWLVDSPLSLGILNFPTLNLAPITVTAGAAATFSLPGMVLLAWIAGIALLLLLALRRHFHLRKILKSLRHFERAAAFLPPGQRLSVNLSAFRHSPFLTGIRRPRIVFPALAQNWSDEQLQAVIAHEAAHIRYGDQWLNLPLLLVRLVYFWHPLVWLLHRQLHDVRERLCDDAAIRSLRHTPLQYARCLLSIAESIVRPPVWLTSAIFFAGSSRNFRNRITYHLTQAEDIVMKQSKLTQFFILMALALLMLPLSCQVEKEPGETIAPPPPTASVMEDDVVVEYSLLTEKPETLEQGIPKYPELAKKAGIEGTVVVKVLVGFEGNVEATELVQSVEVLDEAALEAARQFKFTPAKLDGKPVKVWIAVPFRFKLQ